MRKKKPSIAWPAPRFPGKTFVLESTVSDAEAVERFIKEEGGRVVSAVTASLDYLLTGSRRGNKKTPEKKRADDLNQKGAAIQFLNEQQFYARLLPTRDEALLLLKAGKKGRERWRRLWNYWNDAQTILDFNGLDFRGMDLSGCNFCAVTFTGADLREAKLSDCQFRQPKDVRFDGARLRSAFISEARNCSFKKADLTDASLNAAFANCDFTGAILCGASGSSSQIKDCVFRKANLRKADLHESKLQGLDFSGADLSEAQLAKCDFTGAKLARAKLISCDLTDAVLTGADLSKTDLTDAILINVDLRGATIDGANFTGTTLTGFRLGDIDSSRATGLDPRQVATGGKVGPSIRKLNQIARQSPRLETRAIIDLARKTVTFGITSHQNGTSVDTLIEIEDARERILQFGDCRSFKDGMIDLTKKFIRGRLRLDDITVKCSKGPVKGKELKQLAVRAWCEAMGIELPSNEPEA